MQSTFRLSLVTLGAASVIFSGCRTGGGSNEANLAAAKTHSGKVSEALNKTPPDSAAALKEVVATANALSLSAHERPRINSIGLQSIITFERPTPANRSSVFIPIEGVHLRDANRVSNLSVQVVGTVPATPHTDYELIWTDEPASQSNAAAEIAYVRLNSDYVAKLQAHDRLRVIAAIHRPQSTQAGAFALTRQFAESTAIAHREFVLYDVDTYRSEVMRARVPAHDIQAFPLPEIEVRYLFGPLVSRSYFVVRLTLRNTSKADKLVNSGLISATGRAIVEPVDKSQPTFTVPVTLSPQGPVQVYAALDDRGAWRSRAWVFRSLEFIGALGSAAVTTFTHTPADLAKGTTLFTGVALPEAQKLWPDAWPGYKRNLVTFAMPELTKIPSQSTTVPKYLFFPKRELELFVSDQALFEKPPLFSLQRRIPVRLNADKSSPAVRVVSLGFDSLDVPFENASAPEPPTVAAQLTATTEAVERRIAEMASWRNQVDAASRGGDTARSISNVTKQELKAADDKLTSAIAALKSKAVIKTKEGTPDTEVEQLTQQLKTGLTELKSVAAALLDFGNSKGDLYDQAFTLAGPPAYSLTALKLWQSSAGLALNLGALSYSGSTTREKELTHVRNQLGASSELEHFIHLAATQLTDKDFIAALDTIGKANDQPNDSENKVTNGTRESVLAAYARLKAARTVPVLREFDSVGFDEAARRVTTMLGTNIDLTIVTVPTEKRIKAGEKATFTVQAIGSAPLSYQWLINGAKIDGATSATYSVPTGEAKNGDSYTVVVTDGGGHLAVSPPAKLTVVAPETPGATSDR